MKTMFGDPQIFYCLAVKTIKETYYLIIHISASMRIYTSQWIITSMGGTVIMDPLEIATTLKIQFCQL
jgi:hypothetical protein